MKMCLWKRSIDICEGINLPLLDLMMENGAMSQRMWTASRTGVLKPWDLVSADLRWSWCDNKETNCSINVMHLNNPDTVLPVVQVPGWERRLLKTMQLAIGEFITDSSPPSPRVWGWKARSPSSLGYLLGTIISWRKRIGHTVARQFFLAQCGAFSFPLIGSLFSC